MHSSTYSVCWHNKLTHIFNNGKWRNISFVPQRWEEEKVVKETFEIMGSKNSSAKRELFVRIVLFLSRIKSEVKIRILNLYEILLIEIHWSCVYMELFHWNNANCELRVTWSDERFMLTLSKSTRKQQSSQNLIRFRVEQRFDIRLQLPIFGHLRTYFNLWIKYRNKDTFRWK